MSTNASRWRATVQRGGELPAANCSYEKLVDCDRSELPIELDTGFALILRASFYSRFADVPNIF